MIATNYGYPTNTSAAMAAYARYAQQAYGITPPPLDQSQLSGFYPRMQQTPAQARYGMLQQYGIADPPPGWQTMPLDQFLEWARRARQAQGGQRPGNRPPAQAGSSPLQVHAHAYQNGSGETVPVRTVRINETGNYNSRERTDNPAHYNEVDATYGRGQTGKTYTVTVEWEDGRTQTTQVVNHGWAVDLW